MSPRIYRINSNNMEYRIEKDTLGEMRVEADKLWGAQTQRAMENFQIGKKHIPIEIIYGIATAKKAATRPHRARGR